MKFNYLDDLPMDDQHQHENSKHDHDEKEHQHEHHEHDHENNDHDQEKHEHQHENNEHIQEKHEHQHENNEHIQSSGKLEHHHKKRRHQRKHKHRRNKCHQCHKEHHDQDHESDQHQHHHDHDECHENSDKCHNKSCVCDIVSKIHKAQKEAEQTFSCCRVSCEKSIQQLLSPWKETANTIPFSLNCGCDSCNNLPFLGKAAVYDNKGRFCLISSPFFKVKKINDDCCAVLELLWPTCDGDPFEGTFACCCKDASSIHNFNGFIETGACITVDLKCLCGISCHKPTWTKKATQCQLNQICKANKCN